MTRSKLTFLLIGILLFSNILVNNVAMADNHILPQVPDSAAPVIDGNITAQEWNSTVTFQTTLHDKDTTVFVTTNSTHLFIGFNISTTDFTPVNNTVPTFAPSVENYTLGYNNATHDWFALVLDNNIDQAAAGDSIATSASPDDAVIIDQYRQGAYDGFINGTEMFTPDNSSLTYTGPDNSTTIDGAGGTNDVVTQRNTTSNQVIYEVAKPYSKIDEAGNDFLLSKLGILQFSIY